MTLITWKTGVDGDWTTGAAWIGNVAPTTGNDALINATGAYTVTIAAAEAVTVHSATLNDASATLEVDGTLNLLGGVTPSLQVQSGAVLLGGTIGGGTVNLGANALTANGTTKVGGVLDAAGGTISIATGVLTLANGGSLDSLEQLLGTGTLATTAGTLTIGSGGIYVDNGLTWNNSGTLALGGRILLGFPNHTGTDTITNLATGVIDLVSDSGSIDSYGPGDGSISNAGVFAKTSGTGASHIGAAVNNTGTLSAATGTLELDGGGTFGAKNTITGAGVVALGGGSFTLAGTTAVVTGALSQSGGVVQIDSGKTLTLSGALDASGGTISIATGATLTLASGGSLDASEQLLGAGTLATAGGLAIGAGGIFVDDGLIWSNSGTLALSGRILLGYQSQIGTDTIANLATGVIDLVSDSGSIETYGPGDGTISNAGVFAKISGTGTSAISVLLNNTGILSATTGTLALDGGGTFGAKNTITGAGVVEINGGTFTLAGTTASVIGALSLTGGVVQIDAGKTLTLSGANTWGTGTQINGPGTLLTTGATGFTSTPNLDGSLVWNNSGTVSAGAQLDTDYPSNAGTLTINNLAAGAFDLTADGTAIYVGFTTNFNNFGTLAKTDGTGTSSIAPLIANTGTLTASSGTLELDGGATLGGKIGATGSGELVFGNGTFTVTGATATVTGPLALNGGTLQLGAGKTLSLSGATTLGGTEIDGPGTLVTTGATGFAIDPHFDDSVVWNNTGTVSAGGQVDTDYPSATGLVTINNKSGGDFDFTVDQGVYVGAASSVFNNTGTLEKTGGSGVSPIHAVVVNTGTLAASSGTLELDGGGTLGGTVVQTGTGAVVFGGGSFAFQGAVAVTGTLTFDNSATLAVGTISGTISGASVLESAVTIAAGKTLTLAGATTWGTGTQIDGPGTLVTTGAVGFTTDPHLDDSLLWNNSGTVSDGAQLDTDYPDAGGPLGTAAMIINNLAAGVFDVTADGTAIYVGSTTTFNNAGVLAKIGGTGTSTIVTLLNNTGTLGATTGTLELDGGGTLGAKDTITGAGVVAINGGTFTLAGTTASVTGALSVTGGVVQIDAGKTLTLSGANTWGAGTQINGPGTLATTGATGLTGDAHLDGSLVWNNTGTVSDGAQLDTDYGSGAGTVIINNLAGAAFDLTADGLGIYVGSTTDLNNFGTLAKTGGTGTSSINALLNSNGTLTAVTGTLELDGGGTFGANTVITGAGKVAINAGTYTVPATMATVAGALSLNGGLVQIDVGKTLTLAGANSWGTGTQINGPGTLATTGATSFIGSPNLDGSLVWNNSGTVSAGAQLDTGNPSNTGTETINNLAGGHFNLTADGAAIEIGTPAITNFNNAGTLAKTAGVGISTFGIAVANTGSVTATSGTLELDAGGTLDGEVGGGAGNGVVLLANASSFVTDNANGAVADAGIKSNLRIVNGSTWSDNGSIADAGHIQLGNGTGTSALVIGANHALLFTTDDGGIVNGGGSTLINAGQIAKTSGTGTSVIGMGFSNTGTVLAESGTLKLAAAVSGNGLFVINAADTLELASGAVAGGNTVNMLGALGATLRIDTNSTIAKPIVGLGAGSQIDLAAAATVAAVINGNTLTITPTGGSALNFVSTTSIAGLHIGKSSDGGAGTLVGLYNPAAASAHTPEPVVFGNVHVGDVVGKQTLTVGNTAPANAYTENLDGTLSDTATGFTATGSFTGVAGGASDNTSLTIAMNTATSGNIGGTATLTLASDGAGVDGLGTSPLPTQTVNVTGGVYALAAPVLSASTIALGAARVGGAALTGGVTLGDGSSVNAFQESLIYKFGTAPPAGLVLSNAAGTLVSGHTVVVGATLSTATSGDFTATAVGLGATGVAFTSTGAGTSGLANTALTAPALTVNGQVFATATAHPSASVVNFGVVHTGQVVSLATLSVTNTVAGALTDLLTAGGVSETGSYTDGVTESLLGGAAAGESGKVTFGLVTSSTGVQSGTENLGFFSHDTVLADLALAAVPITVTGTVDNFATAAIKVLAGPAITGPITAETIDFGTVLQNSAAPTVTLDVQNSAIALADKLAGSLTASDAIGFTNTGFAAFSGLVAGAVSGSDIISLATDSVGSFSETITLAATGSNTSFSGALAAQTLIVTGVVAAGSIIEAAASAHTPDPVAFGHVHVGAVVAKQTLTVGNTAAPGSQTENLDGTLSDTAAGFTATGSFTGLVPGASNSSALTIAMNTATSGNIGGTATLTLASDGAGVDGQGTSPLPTQTVNVTGAVYALAVPVLSASTIALGAARVGGAALTGGVTLGDGISVNAFQESLIYQLDTTPAAGLALSNAAGTLVSGHTVVIGATLSTATAGNFTSAVGLGATGVVFTSTGVGTSGLANTVLTAPALTVNGEVFATATAHLANTVNFGVVHTNQVVNLATIGVSNIAAGALADLLTAGGISETGSYTGAVTENLGAGLVGGGASGLVTFGLVTTSSGVQSGTENLDFFSHDTVLADLALAAVPVTVTGTVDNFATAAIKVLTGPAITGPITAQVINLGTVVQNSAAPTVTLDVQNSAIGLADKLAGSFTAPGATGFTNTGFGAFSGLLAGAVSGSDTVSLSTANVGTFSETITLAATGSNTSFSGSLAAQTLVVTGVVNAGAAIKAVASAHTPQPVAFGNVHVGAIAAKALTIGNIAAPSSLTEKLDGTLTDAAAGFTATGSFTGLVAGASNSTALTVTLNTAATGVKNGVATLTLASDGAGVDAAGTSPLPTQTVNVTGAVYALAAPVLSANTITLGAARVGGAALTGGIALGDGSSVNAFQESLVYQFGTALPAGLALSNAAGTLTSGQTVAVGALLSTAIAGNFTATAVGLGATGVAFASTGAGTSGLANTTLAAPTLTVNGQVFAPAKPKSTSTGINFGVVHVGQVVAAVTLPFSNAATGALTDLLTAGTSSRSGGYAGVVTEALGSGVAAGANGSVSFTFPTTTAGIKDGTVNLGFTSHDTVLSDLALAAVPIQIFGTVEAYATASIQALSGGSITGTGANLFVNLGTVLQNSGNLAFSFDVLNSAGGPADTLGGSFAGGINSGFGVSGFAAFSGVGAGQVSGADTLTLSTVNAGFYSQTITLDPTDTFVGSVLTVLPAQTLTIEGTVLPTLTLTAAPTTVTAAQSINTFFATDGALNSRDSITAGPNTPNTLILSGGGVFDLNAPKVLANIQLVNATDGQAAFNNIANTRQTVFLRDGLNVDLVVGAGTTNAANPNPRGITIYGGNDGSVVNLGSGNDTMVLGSVGETVFGGTGNSLVQAATVSIAMARVIGAATGTTTLEIAGGGNVQLNAADTHVTVKLDVASVLNLNAMSFMTGVGSNGNDTINANAAGQVLTGGAGVDNLMGFSGFGDTFSDTSAGLNNDVLKQFGGSDKIDLTDMTFGTLKPLAFSANKLTVSDGVHTAILNFTGTNALANFHAATDTHTGTMITHLP